MSLRRCSCSTEGAERRKGKPRQPTFRLKRRRHPRNTATPVGFVASRGRSYLLIVMGAASTFGRYSAVSINAKAMKTATNKSEAIRITLLNGLSHRRCMK